MKNRLLLMAAILAWILVPVWMFAGQQARQQRISAPSPAPLESYSRPPDAPFTRSD